MIGLTTNTKQIGGTNLSVLCAFFLVFFVFNLATPITAQAQPEVEASIAPKEILIGAPSTLTLQIKHATDVTIFWPTIGETIAIDSAQNVEVLEQGKIDTILSGGYMQQSIKLQVTAWDTGFYIIPSFNFSYKTASDTAPHTLQNYPVLLQVNTVPVDTTQAFKPIKDPLEVPFSIWEYKYWIMGGAVILIALVLLLLYIFRRKEVAAIIGPPKKVVPPHQMALERLRELERQQLWQQGDVKGYYSGISDTMREYLEGRFRFAAVELTTYEIFASLDQTQMSPKQREQIKEVFTLSDLAKFAKMQPLPDDHMLAMQYAKEFVNSTKPTDVSSKDV
ncbi:hypothetical protein BH09BAC1_BH09BAC1_03400 [soil metagenome]